MGSISASFQPKISKIGQEMAELWPIYQREVGQEMTELWPKYVCPYMGIGANLGLF